MPAHKACSVEWTPCKLLNLFKAKDGMTGDLSESSGALKEEILQLLKEKERTLLKQVLALALFSVGC